MNTELTLLMLRLLSAKAQGRKDFRKSSKPCHVGIHWIGLAEYSQISTHVPGFQPFSLGFCIMMQSDFCKITVMVFGRFTSCGLNLDG